MGFAAVHIPEFPAAALLCCNPELRSRALAVLDGAAPHERVVSLTGAAKGLGLEHGMSKVQAQAAGHLVLSGRTPSLEEKAFRQVLGIAEQFSPRVEAIASPANGYGGAQRLDLTLLLDQGGTESLFGPPKAYAAKLHHALVGARFESGVATSPNAEASLLLARASRGVTCAAPEDLAAKLAPLHVSSLACPAETLAVFSRWGIRTLGQLAQLPETGLVSRLGQKGLRLQQLARGIAEHLLVAQEPELALIAGTELDTPLENLESLRFVLSPLLEQILRKAAERAYTLRVLRLELKLERTRPHQTEIRPAVPTSDRELWLRLLSLELEAHPPQDGIVAATLCADPSEPQTAQRGLFQSTFPEPDRLDLLLARLRSIVGEDNVGAPELPNSPRADLFSMASYRPHVTGEVTPTARPGRRVMRAFRPPQAVRVSLKQGEPEALVWQGSKRQIVTAVGPWHSNGCWWDHHTWDTEEWDAIVTDPLYLLRLQLDRSSKGWFVVGQYD